MTTALHVLLVRHGQTALNAEGRLRGLADPELDDIGIAQATATATALTPQAIVRVHSSPLRRASATATIIAHASRVNHRVDPGFNDRDYGPWTGELKSEVVERWGSVDAAPGVEPQAAVLVRATAALDALIDTDRTGTVAVVTHDAVIRPLLSAIQPGIQAVVDTGSGAELLHADEGWRILSIDNTAPTS